MVWTRPNVNGKAFPIKTAWFTIKGCNCPYEYTGILWEPTEIPRWLEELTNLFSKEKVVLVNGDADQIPVIQISTKNVKIT